uniref:DNA-binding protein n=1 Tax=Marinobacter nauticus TaxID=2743 RepID=A0A455W7U6_MARNT|nr:hypothetical protein YBY_08650 [Marinobacter nauticus]
MELIEDRAKLLIKKAGIDNLARSSKIGNSRWKAVLYKGVRMSTNELEVVKKLYPQYSLWLICGDIAPETGQTSPQYDEVNSKLDSHAEG